MKVWVLTLAMGLALAGCENVSGIYAESPVTNEAHFTGAYLKPEEVDKAPVAIEQRTPDYPPRMLKAEMDGAVIVALIVDEHGQPQQVQAEQATHPLFADAAVASVQHWKFTPAMKNGQPVACAITLPIEFRHNTVTDRPKPEEP